MENQTNTTNQAPIADSSKQVVETAKKSGKAVVDKATEFA